MYGHEFYIFIQCDLNIITLAELFILWGVLFVLILKEYEPKRLTLMK